MTIALTLNATLLLTTGLVIINFLDNKTMFWFLDSPQAFVNLILLGIVTIKLITNELPYTPNIIYGLSIPIIIVILFFTGVIKRGLKNYGN